MQRTRTPWAALPVVLTGTFMVVLDFFIVNVALPAMQAGLGASDGALQWIVAGYALTAAVFLVPAARLGDAIGRRRAFALGLGLFTLASGACGATSSPTVLVVARLVQGAAAALLAPNVLAILGTAFAGEDRVRAFGRYGLVMGLAAVGGQLIGGVLVEGDVLGLGWRAVFLINVPVGLVALALTPRLVPESRAPGAARPDLLGTALVTAAATALVLPLVSGREDGWPLWTWLSLGAAPALLAAFAAQQRRLAARGGAPLVPVALVRSRAFAATLATQLAFWCGQASYFLVLALYLQQGRGLGALDAGLVFTVLAVAYVVTSARAPQLAARHGRRILVAGALTLAAGHGLLLAAVAAQGTGGTILDLVPGLLLAGAGMGLMIVPLTTLAMGAVAPEHAGAASGALATMQNMGGAIGVAVTGALFFGALDRGFAHAFELSLGQLVVLLLAVGALARLVPARTPAPVVAAPAAA
jgi:EmrB/QacA subfamily drug resistance transporter